MVPKGPTVNRRQLGAELRRLRVARDIQIKDAADHLGCSQTRMSRLETGKGRVTPRPDELVSLCELYGVTDEWQVQRLLAMATDAKQPGWWDPYREVLPSGLEVLFGLEADASAERVWEPVLIHGLLQTPKYARAVLAEEPSIRLPDIDDLVSVRASRQELLTSDTRAPLNLWAILDEQAIRRPAGGPAVMREQIAHLLDVAERPNVVLQILELRKGAHPGLGGGFSLLEFEEEGADPVVYIDSQAGNLYLERKPDVRRFKTSFDLLTASALDQADSKALLWDAAKEIK